MTDNTSEEKTSTEEFAEAISRHLNSSGSYRNMRVNEVSEPAAELHRLIFGDANASEGGA